MIETKEIRRLFPILNRRVNNQPLIYFDNGATTQKPKKVIDSINKYYENENANVHRGVHFLSGLSTDNFEKTRDSIKSFIGAKHSHEIIFTKGTTDAINLVANGFKKFLKKGDDIIISELEHHSNIVPWQICCEITGANLKVIPLLENGSLNLKTFNELISKKTKLIAISHVSNTLGTINPIKEIIKKGRQFGAKVLVDGAQAIAHIKLNMQKLDVDFYCFSAHKLYGPTGVGVLYGKEALLEELPPYQGGGEMIKEVSFKKTSYADLPHKFEAGTPNISGVIAFRESIRFVKNIGLKKIAEHEEFLLKYATNKLEEIKNLKIYGTAKNKSAIISFNIAGVHPYDLGLILDKMGVAVRTGHHCTQPIMERFKIPGTVRISFAIYNTKKEIDVCVSCIKKALKMLT